MNSYDAPTSAAEQVPDLDVGRSGRKPTAHPSDAPTVAELGESLRTALATSARRLVDTRVDSPHSTAMLHTVVASALDMISSAAGASVTMIDRHGAITTHAPSDDRVAGVDELQAALGEGPCIDALRSVGDGVTDVPDLGGGVVPWPRLVPHVRRAGFAAVLSFHLSAGRSAGALNLWGREPDGFTEHERLLGALFADQAAVALAGARRATELTRALINREAIGRAKGVLMERFRISDGEAFTMLIESSQSTNLKLADVANWVITDAEAGYAAERAAGTVDPA
ncbi:MULTISPECIES: GAF and ANTAR domain-containing protein [Pseudonocardia]|jgi:GAF domain-containing protein|uniref:GAF and ANTAR domain-containing protein n=2 Tax=Pseudonocardiaceae TaxID=2070 RepID=UPI000910EB7B|nr:ANTAR domain protein [Pseudonocardia autotrophica]